VRRKKFEQGKKGPHKKNKSTNSIRIEKKLGEKKKIPKKGFRSEQQQKKGGGGGKRLPDH